MKQPNKELIKEIVDLFEDYEEAYVPGEWEVFSKNNKKKKYLPFSPWIKVAAIFLLLLSVLLIFNLKNLVQKKQTVATIAASKPKVKPSKPLILKKDSLVTPDSGKSQTKTLIAAVPVPVNVPGSSGRVAVPIQLYRDTVAAQIKKQLVPVEIQQAVIAGRVKTDTVVKAKQDKTGIIDKVSTIDFLLAESKNTGKKTEKKENGSKSKWDFGVEVAPTMTHSNMNVGGGLTTAYRLSDKFSLSSGISLLQLEAGKKYSPSVRSNISAAFNTFSDKELLAMDANIKAIDIPVAIVYKLNKHYYTSAGISYFNVISEKRNNTFIRTSQVNVAGVNPETGQISSYTRLVNTEVAEPTSENSLSSNSYLGFFNFSVGRRQSLFNKYNILVEPFIKVPVGKLSAEDLKLMNSGVKFQLSF